MKAFVAKRWFVLLLTAGVTLALVRTDDLLPVVEPIPLRLVVALNLFLMACGLENRKLRQALAEPLPALWSVAISYGLLPLLGWLIGSWFALPDYRIGLLVITAVPCTVASAVIWTRLAGGNEALALLITLLTMCSSWLVTPLWLAATSGALVDMAPSAMMRDLVLCLVLPVALGQLVRWPTALRQLATRGKRAIDVLSRLLIFVVILQAVVLAAHRLQYSGLTIEILSLLGAGLACLVLHVVAWGVGFWGGRGLGFDRPDRIAVAFTASQKTLPVSLLLLNTYFRSYALAVIPVLLYHVGQLLLDTVIADVLLNTRSPEESAAGQLNLKATGSSL
jgi:sodium/bile acid cotransporter 7